MNSNLYSTEDLEKLSELRIELVKTIKSKEDVKNDISPLRKEKDSYNLQIEECEKRYAELSKKGESISLEEAEEMSDLINNIKTCRIEKIKIEEKILEFGKQLREINSKKEEIEKEIDDLNNSVQENLSEKNEKIDGTVEIKSPKTNLKNVNVNLEKCAIISTKKKSEMSLRRIFSKNEENKLSDFTIDLIDKINNSSFIKKVREISESISLAKEEFEKRINTELMIKDIEKQCDEEQNKEIISDEEPKLEYIENDKTNINDNVVPINENGGLRLSTEEEMNKRFEEQMQIKSPDVMKTNLKLKNDISPLIQEKQDALDKAKGYLENEKDSKIQDEIKQEIDARQKELDDQIKKESEQIDSDQVNLFETPISKNEEIVTDKNNTTSFEKVDVRKNQTSTATKEKLRYRISPTFIENGSIEHVIKLENGKVIGVKSKNEVSELNNFSQENIVNNQDIFSLENNVGNLFEQATENNVHKAM